MRLVLRGKVRDVHDAGDGRLLLVASDRISAYDVILPTPIPDKGRALTGLSAHWFAETADILPNHLVSTRVADLPGLPEGADAGELAGRVMLVRRLEMLPVECVVRGYLAGSGWRDYLDTGAVCGHRLPPGLRQADRLPEPIFTPATKAHEGHDENVTFDDVADMIGRESADEVRRVSIALYERAAERCARAGIILADTKLELGRDADGRLVLGDEAFTSDSSRFWPADRYAPGQSPPSFDKQYVRDWLDTLDWDRTPPGPELPADVVAGTRSRYIEAYERITGRSFDDYLKETG
ncbi:MAG: phosphoribosylaminoimidazolesuccinocarboxamide synthase [Actinomycetota bacterium]